MIRQFRHVAFIVIFIIAFSAASTCIAQHQWKSLDGPYWAKGNDVALGSGGYNYLLGTDGDLQAIFYDRPQDQEWIFGEEDDNAIEMILAT